MYVRRKTDTTRIRAGIALLPIKATDLLSLPRQPIGFNALRNSIEDFDSEEALPHPYQWTNFSPEEVTNHDERPPGMYSAGCITSMTSHPETS